MKKAIMGSALSVYIGANMEAPGGRVRVRQPGHGIAEHERLHTQATNIHEMTC